MNVAFEAGFGVTYWPREWAGEGFLRFLTRLVATVVATSE
jgi:hypothetical protein